MCEELMPAIEAMTPEGAAELTGVVLAAIEDVAIRHGGVRSIVWLGQGMERQAMGGNVFRALPAHVALTGNIAKRGGDFLYLNGSGTRY